MLHAWATVRNFREVVFPKLLLLFETEWAVVGGHHLKVVEFQSAPELVLIPLLPNRRRHHPLRPFESRLLVDAVIEKKILRAGLRVRGNAVVARAHDFIEASLQLRWTIYTGELAISASAIARCTPSASALVGRVNA